MNVISSSETRYYEINWGLQLLDWLEWSLDSDLCAIMIWYLRAVMLPYALESIYYHVLLSFCYWLNGSCYRKPIEDYGICFIEIDAISVQQWIHLKQRTLHANFSEGKVTLRYILWSWEPDNIKLNYFQFP